MSKTVFRKALPSDYPGIIRLQEENLIANIGEATAREGFLSIEFIERDFDEMNKDLAVIVAVRNGETLGYLCGTSCEYGARFPVINALISMLPGLSIEGVRLTALNSFIYGPVCVSRSSRGSGVLEGLYGKLKEFAKPRYDFCLLFISETNSRSLDAHLHKLRMKDLGQFDWNGKSFRALGAAI